MKLRKVPLLLFFVLLGRATVATEQPAPQSIILASTTSVENSGLLAHILPAFSKETGIIVHVLAQGTGQALQTAARDDADLVLVHDPEAEQKFIAAGDGIDRRQIAWNDFIVVGPRSDPAHIAGTHDAVAALKAIADLQTPFVSRGDKSGTDALEHRLWRAAGIDPAKADGGSWYRDIGGGMGAALNAAQAMNACTISDRGTWLSFGNKDDLTVLVEGDTQLLNHHDVILLNPAKHPVPKQALARRFAQWLVSSEGQAAIGAYKVPGEQLFHPSATAPKEREGDLTGSRRRNQSGRKPMPRLTVRIDFDGGRAVGPGKIKLMEMIDKHGSISEAGRQMGMSYRRAWLLVDSLNRCFRAPVVIGQREGGQGGGASLTKFGHDIVHHYRAVESAAVKAGAAHMRALSAALAEETAPAGVIRPRPVTLSLNLRGTAPAGSMGPSRRRH